MAQLQLPAFFGDHMVLQRDMPIKVWGEATPGKRVVVEMAGKKSSAKADKTGRWSLYLPAMKAGGPYTMVVKSGKEMLKYEDVLMGEVWLCSGQSNMEWRLRDVRNAEIAAELCREIAPELPIIISATLSKIGGLLVSGRPIENFVEDVSKFEPLAIGFNCSYGVKNVVDNIELLTRFTTLPTYAAPSAGIPDQKGRHPETAKKHTETLRTAAERGLLNIVGGCCGTTVEYTRGVAQMARHYKPRK